MSEIDDLLKISNRGHDRLSGVARFWVVLTVVSFGVAALLVLVLTIAVIFAALK